MKDLAGKIKCGDVFKIEGNPEDFGIEDYDERVCSAAIAEECEHFDGYVYVTIASIGGDSNVGITIKAAKILPFRKTPVWTVSRSEDSEITYIQKVWNRDDAQALLATLAEKDGADENAALTDAFGESGYRLSREIRGKLRDVSASSTMCLED